MFRKTAMVAVTAGALTLLLAGCGKTTLSTTKTTYKPNGLVAAVKGKSNVKKVHYQLDGGQTKTATVRNHTFVIQVPTKTTRQTVKIKAGSDTTTVHVKGAKKLVGYQKMATTYNQALIASKLSKSDQQAAKKLQTEGAALKKQQATIQAKVKQAQAQIKLAVRRLPRVLRHSKPNKLLRRSSRPKQLVCKRLRSRSKRQWQRRKSRSSRNCYRRRRQVMASRTC
ncbi:hypothetical protein N574_0117080 [Lactiplantibacillus plantarum 2165]|nr:hypothetical protein N574_0117080 [Lactiplantibacillus plantarum 2165]